MQNSRIYNVANMSFNVIRENKILAKISEFTVASPISYLITNFAIKDERKRIKK